jgi:hypothetical protein
VSETPAATAPVGVRRVILTAAGEASPFRVERLCWADPGPIALQMGDRVVVQDGVDVWAGEVVIPASQVLEWPDDAGRPTVVRRATDAEWPDPPPAAGRRLLDSLGLPPELLRPTERR